MKNSRKSGVLMHISSLPGDYSTGSFGYEAKRFIDYLDSAGFSYWQVLPFGMTDECNSPYKSLSAFGGNPYFIDLPTLYEEGLLEFCELERAKQSISYACEFEKLKKERLSLLHSAAMRVLDRSPVIKFMDSHEELNRVAIFMAKREKNNGLPWYLWKDDGYLLDDLFFWQFVQYKFYTQWMRIKKYANDKGIKIIGDMPIYIAHDSADVYYNKDQFLLDSKGYPTSVSGVPPDYFCKDGQLWGNPIYNWDKMKKDGFSWWRKRLQYSFELFDGIRIDHFRAFASYWSIPKDSETARSGHWETGPKEAVIDCIKEVAGEKLVIAEDLGDITDDVRKLLDYSGFPGMRVFQFAFMGNSESIHLPHNYSKNTVCYTGTHDNNTLLGYIWEIDSETRDRVQQYTGAPKENWALTCDAVIRTLFESHADTVIIPIQDIMLFGADTRMNTPGTDKRNWQYRLTKEQLKNLNCEKFLKLNTLYSRQK